MLKITSFFKKTILVALMAALASVALPVTSVHAIGLSDPTDPPPDASSLTGERLEQACPNQSKDTTYNCLTSAPLGQIEGFSERRISGSSQPWRREDETEPEGYQGRG